MFDQVYIRLSPEDSRRFLEIVYPGEPDPQKLVRESRRRRQLVVRGGTVALLLIALVVATPLIVPLVALVLNR